MTTAYGSGASDVLVTPTLDNLPGTFLSYDSGGRRRLGTGHLDFTPAVVSPPTTGGGSSGGVGGGGSITLPGAVEYVAARVIDSVAGVGAARTYTYRDERAIRAAHRVIVNHVDVTYFRGAETPEPTWELIAPGLYGPGRITFPQIRSDEHLGTGDLSWITPWAPVHVHYGTDVAYKGLLSDFDLDGTTFASTLAGQLTGRAAVMYRPTPVFREPWDIGGMVKSMVRGALRLPVGGPDMGITVLNTGGQQEVDWLNEVMALSQLRDGTAWTLMPDAAGVYQLVQKDVTTVHYSLYLDDARTVPHLRRDFAAEPNREFADAVRPDGLHIRFATYPGLQFGPRPPFPSSSVLTVGTTDADTDSGFGVTQLIWRLFILGFIDRDDKIGYDFDSDVADGVARAQSRAGLLDEFVSGEFTTAGVVNRVTWEALWDLNATGASIRGSHIRPAAQLRTVHKYRVNATGQRVALNPFYDPTVVRVDQATSMGAGRRRPQVENWAKREIHDGATPNWVGTIDVNMGAVIAGEHNPDDAFSAGDLVDARAIRPGTNLWLPRFQGGTLVHISGVSKGDGANVTLTVDTRARDSMKVWEIIDRNREARVDPARNFLNGTLRSRQVNDSATPWDDVGGQVPDLIDCPGNTWTVFPVVAGQEGQIRDLFVQTTDSPAEYCLAVFGRNIDAARLDQLCPTPLTADGARNWRRHHIELTTNHFLLYAAGIEDNPCGYYPTTKAAAADDFPFGWIVPFPTGQFRDEAGFPYFCDGEPVVRVAIWPDRDTHVARGRIFRAQQDDQN